MGYLSDIFTGHYAGIIILAGGMTAAVFAGFSGSRKINISMAAINALSYTGAIYMYIRNYLISGAAAGLLTDLGLSGTVLSAIILFCGLNILLFLSLERSSNKIFVRNVILLSFSIVSVLFLIMADNTILFTVSLIISILSIFNLLASLGGDKIPAREYTAKFGMRAALPAAMALFGFSVLAGTSRIGSLSSYANMENTFDPLILIGALLFGGAVYLYLFLYPFQGVYLRLTRRVSTSSGAILWFLYVPAGIVLLIKFDPIFSNYFGRESIYGFSILTILAFLNLIGAGVGSIRALSIKRIISMFLLFQLGTILLVRAAGYTAQSPGYITSIFDIAVLVIILIIFLPLSVLALIIERGSGDDSLNSAGGLLRDKPYLGVCFIILFIWWMAANAYIFFLKGPFPGTGLYGHGIEASILSAGYIGALLLMAANIVRAAIVLFRKPPVVEGSKNAAVPRIFYIYISFFVFLAIASLVLVIIGKAAIGQDSISIWGNVFYIFGGGN